MYSITRSRARLVFVKARYKCLVVFYCIAQGFPNFLDQDICLSNCFRRLSILFCNSRTPDLVGLSQFYLLQPVIINWTLISSTMSCSPNSPNCVVNLSDNNPFSFVAHYLSKTVSCISIAAGRIASSAILWVFRWLLSMPPKMTFSEALPLVSRVT